MGLLTQTYRVVSVQKTGIIDHDVTVEWLPSTLSRMLFKTEPFTRTYRGYHHWRVYPTAEEVSLEWMDVLQMVVARHEMQHGES